MKFAAMSFAMKTAMQRAAYHHGYHLDPFQCDAVERLGDLAGALSTRRWRRSLRGVYLWGAVGRGKTFLLDTFFDAMPLAHKKRMHFHAFFLELHRRTFEQSPRANALEFAIDGMLGDCRLLCFDELHLHDIGDALIIRRCLMTIFARGTVLITTSNYAPDDLLANQPYHDRFVPTIELIKKHMDIVAIAGEIDYRGSSHAKLDPFSQGCYVCPGSNSQRELLGLPQRPAKPYPLAVGRRELLVLNAEQKSLHVSFEHICEGLTATMDYLVLAARFHRWIIEDLPPLSVVSLQAQQRFINLIDVLYDRRCEMFIVGIVPLPDALHCFDLPDMPRVKSRLSQLNNFSM